MIPGRLIGFKSRFLRSQKTAENKALKAIKPLQSLVFLSETEAVFPPFVAIPSILATRICNTQTLKQISKDIVYFLILLFAIFGQCVSIHIGHCVSS